jgi:hypothetical protein
MGKSGASSPFWIPTLRGEFVEVVVVMLWVCEVAAALVEVLVELPIVVSEEIVEVVDNSSELLLCEVLKEEDVVWTSGL